VVTYTPGVDEVDEVDVDVDLDDPLQFGSVSCADNFNLQSKLCHTEKTCRTLENIYFEF
jgi:hypothetical protein